jgi:hypothetical protein
VASLLGFLYVQLAPSVDEVALVVYAVVCVLTVLLMFEDTNICATYLAFFLVARTNNIVDHGMLFI